MQYNKTTIYQPTLYIRYIHTVINNNLPFCSSFCIFRALTSKLKLSANQTKYVTFAFGKFDTSQEQLALELKNTRIQMKFNTDRRSA